MSDVAEVKEAIEWVDAQRDEMSEEYEPVIALADAARRWVRVVEGLDYEDAISELIDWLDRGRLVNPREAVKAIVDAAVGVEKDEETQDPVRLDAVDLSDSEWGI